MSRPLIALVLAVLLCCQAVVVFAQILVEAGLHHDLVAQTLWSDASASSDDFPRGAGTSVSASVSTDDTDIGHGIEVAFEGYALELIVLPGALPRSFASFSSSTFLAPPKRPPRISAFLA
ncbi:hypothetical protein [Variovorax sp.]|jgi:hypothetical protein|uniref:hypothetical protein n=1 Tax=Variovorax sp. TaxID=1871043 RepID=UPI0012198F5B|nr:hypothetical protein [Variovorax sp.]TAJ65656.1 MAG: hypothetical protein EPO53_09300 [Variovorax sp.]